jgi:hypothetical protein
MNVALWWSPPLYAHRQRAAPVKVPRLQLLKKFPHHHSEGWAFTKHLAFLHVLLKIRTPSAGTRKFSLCSK